MQKESVKRLQLMSDTVAFNKDLYMERTFLLSSRCEC